MDFLDEFRNRDLVVKLTERLRQLKPPPVRFMEVCGTHTVSIARFAIRALMPDTVTLTSGPGCPVCVTSTTDIDRFIAASNLENTIVTTFGDLIKVPGSNSSLKDEMAAGRDVRIVYSPLDCLEIAADNPDKQVVFLGVGFETTTPTVAATILQAQAANCPNFSIISAHKIMPPALAALVSDPAITLSGLLCPGNVSVIIGADSYLPLVEKYALPCVIAGFEPLDILQGVILLCEQVISGRPRVDIGYQRAVSPAGNRKAQMIMDTVFEPEDSDWRGLGVIPQSGLRVRKEFERFDAMKRFSLDVPIAADPPGCKCGDVLKGIMDPPDCRLFGKVCQPNHPVGPCMVSSEGGCAAFYKYGGKIAV